MVHVCVWCRGGGGMQSFFCKIFKYSWVLTCLLVSLEFPFLCFCYFLINVTFQYTLNLTIPVVMVQVNVTLERPYDRCNTNSNLPMNSAEC